MHLSLILLNTPDEVSALRRIYGNGFILIGVFVKSDKREDNLVQIKGLSKEESNKLMDRDEAESQEYGQQTRIPFI